MTYSNRSKERLLGVPREILEKKGAVSREAAIAMAKGIREREETDLGLAVTGIAGPDGGTPEKPVGLVYMALSDRHQTGSFVFRFTGDRNAIQSQAARMALELLRRHLIGIEPDPSWQILGER